MVTMVVMVIMTGRGGPSMVTSTHRYSDSPISTDSRGVLGHHEHHHHTDDDGDLTFSGKPAKACLYLLII